MPPLWTTLLALFSVLSLGAFYWAALDVQVNLSPQGCRMSTMYPSYILQEGFNVDWTPLAARYSLWLYREGGWESTPLHRGIPVLFIPGNAGSSRQVRSIASSAARQYFSRPYGVDAELKARGVQALDVFAVEFNEDLSAFHGPTMEAEIAYTARAIEYILSFYPSGTSIIILGHSMGGIVATSLLPSERIAAIITMSTPHTTPPARFDHRIDEIYDRNLALLYQDPTPILSLCGGATDLMIPSEFCILPKPQVSASADRPYRRTVFSSALEGAWTGVGHREMVWCHQVRWRIAKAALELTIAPNPSTRAAVLDRWLRDGHRLPPMSRVNNSTISDPSLYQTLPPNLPFTLKKPQGRKTYLLPTSTTSGAQFVLMVSQGTIAPVSPQRPSRLRVSVSLCHMSTSDNSIMCSQLAPSTQKLIPNPVYGQTFPVPHEGSDESEGVVFFEADVPSIQSDLQQWIGIDIEDADGSGWVVGGMQNTPPIAIDVGTSNLVFGRSQVILPNHSFHLSVNFPGLVSNALVAYRITAHSSSNLQCSDLLLPPLLAHNSAASETHYFPLSSLSSHRPIIHTHASAPHSHRDNLGLQLSIYSSGRTGCSSDIVAFDITTDWIATLGRCATRYFTALSSWAIAVVSLILFNTLGERPGPVSTVDESLSLYCTRILPKLLLGVFVTSFVPLPDAYFLGNYGNPHFAILAPLLLLLASGLVCVSWWLITLLMYPLARIDRAIFGLQRRRETVHSVRRSTIISMAVIFVLVFLFIPWQVAFLACWIIHLQNCATSAGQTPINPPDVQLDTMNSTGMMVPVRPVSNQRRDRKDNHNLNMHILLFMTWLLPLAAPVLVVWVRTLATAGLATPFDGDHFCLNVAPFLIVVDFASWTKGPLFERQRFEQLVSVRWGFVVLSAVGFIIGSRKAYFVFDTAKFAIGLLVVVQIGPRYWGRPSWSSAEPIINAQ